VPIVQHPFDPADAHVNQLQHMFNRVLQSWAMDILSLQRRGLDRPSLRGEDEAWEIEDGSCAGGSVGDGSDVRRAA
jgi:hypothetical protein